jgi:hypothetical protein
MPDVYGLGLSFRSKGDALTIGFEWDRVEYASIVDSLDTTSLDVTVTLDDGDEFHLGTEYVFPRSTPIVALRGGLWYDPEHRLRATDDAGQITQALRQPGDDEIHLAAGVGLVFKKIQLDLGIDISELINTASLSAIFSF